MTDPLLSTNRISTGLTLGGTFTVIPYYHAQPLPDGKVIETTGKPFQPAALFGAQGDYRLTEWGRQRLSFGVEAQGAWGPEYVMEAGSAYFKWSMASQWDLFRCEARAGGGLFATATPHKSLQSFPGIDLGFGGVVFPNGASGIQFFLGGRLAEESTQALGGIGWRYDWGRPDRQAPDVLASVRTALSVAQERFDQIRAVADKLPRYYVSESQTAIGMELPTKVGIITDYFEWVEKRQKVLSSLLGLELPDMMEAQSLATYTIGYAERMKYPVSAAYPELRKLKESADNLQNYLLTIGFQLLLDRPDSLYKTVLAQAEPVWAIISKVPFTAEEHARAKIALDDYEQGLRQLNTVLNFVFSSTTRLPRQLQPRLQTALTEVGQLMKDTDKPSRNSVVAIRATLEKMKPAEAKK